MNTDSLSIQSLQKHHLNEILKIEENCFSDPWNIDEFNYYLNDNSYSIIGVINNKIIGYGISIIYLDEMHIINMAIDINYRHKGYGCILLKNLINKAIELKLDIISLEVRMANIVAQNLYKKYSFYEVAYRKNYYKTPPDDALVMIKKL